MKKHDQRQARRERNHKRAARALAFAAVALGNMPVLAIADSATFNIGAQPLPVALKVFAAQAHMQVFYANSVVQNQRASEVHGNLDKHDALTQLLRDTGLKAVYTSGDAATIVLASGPTLQQKTRARRGPRTVSDQADAGAGGSPEALQVILVTAEKRKEPLQTVPVPVSVVAAPELAKRSKFRLQDYASQVPGLSVTPSEFNASSTVAIRGIISADTTNPTVATTIDDVPMGSSTSIGGGFIVADLDPNDLSGIEVLRGPQGTLYGASSIGGLVKYVTKDPSTHALTGTVRVGTNAVYSGGSAGYDVSAGVNVPLSDTLAIRGGVSGRADPGYITDIQLGRQHDVNRTRDYGANVATLWRPSDMFSAKLSAFYQQSKIYGSAYITVAPGVGDLQQSMLPNTGTVDRKFGALIAVVTAKLGMFELTSDTGYTVAKLVDNEDYSASTGEVTLALLNTPYALATDDVTTHKISQEFRLSTHIGPRLEWLLGAFFTHEYSPYTIGSFGANAEGQSIGIANLTVLSSVYQELAGFTDLTYHFTNRFDVQVGGRVSRIRQGFQSRDIAGDWDAFFGTPNSFPETDVYAHSTTYLITPRLRITPDLMIYARVASGYRPGGINPVPYVANAPREFRPDTTVNYELGIKGEFLDRRLSIDGSLFYIDWQKIQLSITDPATGAPYFTNGSGAKSEGVELSAALVPVGGLKLAGWFTYDKAVLTKSMPPDASAYGAVGDRLPYSSRYAASASADYDFPVGALTASVGATVSYVGDRIGTFVADVPGVSSQRQALPGYTEFDFRSALNGDLWSLEFYVNNAGDRRGIVGGGIGTLTPTEFEIIQPRTIGISMTRKFL